jgi:hypothetical protein
MISCLSWILVASGPLASPQDNPKDQKEASPSETVKQWIDAAANRDQKTLAQLAGKSTSKQSLKLIEQQGFLNYRGAAKIIHEEICADRAVVVYRLENRDAVFTPEISYDIVTLVREANQWKVDMQGGGVLKAGKQPGR